MKFVLIYFIALIACLPLALKGQDQPKDKPPCSSYARCNDLGGAALKQGHLEKAIKFFEQQAAFAEVADIDRQTGSRVALLHSPYKLSLTAYNNLALAYF